MGCPKGTVYVRTTEVIERVTAPKAIAIAPVEVRLDHRDTIGRHGTLSRSERADLRRCRPLLLSSALKKGKARGVDTVGSRA